MSGSTILVEFADVEAGEIGLVRVERGRTLIAGGCLRRFLALLADLRHAGPHGSESVN